MKTEILRKLLLLAVFPLAMAQCDKIQEPEADSLPSGRTVTLTAISADAEASTRTMLENDRRVLWSVDDIVHIIQSDGNVWDYMVIPDEGDPVFATIPDVMESDEYLAFYSGNGAYIMPDEENIYPYVERMQQYIPGSFYGGANPMAAYSTTTELQFHNLGSVIRIGITGNASVSELSLTGNNGESVSGYMAVPKTDVVNGSYSRTYRVTDEDDPDFKSVQMWVDGHVALDPSSPTYFYFGVVPQSFSEGFTVYARDSQGNVSIRSTFAATDAFRSEIVAMEPFEFEPVSAPVIAEMSAAASSISGTVNAVKGAHIKAAAFMKSEWDTMSESERESVLEYVFAGKEADFMVGIDGTCAFTLNSAFSFYNETVILPENEYVVVVDYSDINSTFGLLSSAEVTTAAASGEAPGLSVGLESVDKYFEMCVTISASNASNIRYCILPEAEYRLQVESGRSDREIVLERGLLLPDDALETALSGVLYNWFEDYTLIPATDYVLLVLAMSEGGMETISSATASTLVHIAPDAQWQTVAETYADCNFHIHTLGAVYYYSGEMSVEKMSGKNIFRLHIPLYSDEAFVMLMEEAGFVCDYEDFILYIDGTLPDGTMLMPSLESFTGFTQEGRPLWVTNLDMPGKMNFDGEYLYATGEFFLWTGNSVSDMLDTGHIGNFDINVHLPGGIPVSGGASNESYEIKDEVAWD